MGSFYKVSLGKVLKEENDPFALLNLRTYIRAGLLFIYHPALS